MKMKKLGHQSDREKILNRTFKMYIRKGRYTKDDFHAFCHFAKSKSEYTLLSELGV